EAAVRRILRMKRQAEQASFAAGEDPAADVEEHGGGRSAGLQHPDPADLFFNEQAVRPVPGVSDEQRACQSRDDLRDLDLTKSERRNKQRGCKNTAERGSNPHGTAFRVAAAVRSAGGAALHDRNVIPVSDST